MNINVHLLSRVIHLSITDQDLILILVATANIFAAHNWIHVYCNHALLWVHADQAEQGCHPGPESRAFMADLQMLATYPVYGIILNVIPYAYPAIVGFLVVAALPEHIFIRTSALPDEPAKRAF